MTSTTVGLTEAGHAPAQHQHHDRKGFFTDTSICIGCKACEVACKEWNRNPADSTWELSDSSYDNTGSLGADTWRHVAFIEQDQEQIEQARESGRRLVSLGMPSVRRDPDTQDLSGVDTTPPDTPDFRWLMSSDVCKHCTNAGCLDVCPTGALFRTEYGTVVVQEDICNGCGTCVAGCPFGVIERRKDGIAQPKTNRDFTAGEQAPTPNVGVAQKCTLCYDRLTDDQTPACAQACPTTSIKFGSHEELAKIARARVRELHRQGLSEARLYGANENDGVGGTGSIFLLLDEPEVYGLPPDPRVATADLPRMYKRAGMAALGMIGAAALAFVAGGRR
ncbi:4Fe-4S dicluster domain-containing protein [Citricoccus muralis]|uniref:4Fe-4S dicluster domain-containing protein n=1 Tax=Citricoccus muralis TaxID=169134 RepID=A0ABY8H734_9MICC|nr:4Fe-4S dicluster domain-containing protein [Citricoccus muralis]WFP16634.1 4Fe-4S dicluster domain-containing protein [Citricoccus muralis]